MKVVTTSWDDGDLCDLKLAEILRSKGAAGTFYVPLRPCEGRSPLAPSDLRSLSSEGFEIGAHSLLHRNLAKVSAKELYPDIRSCKHRLEDVTGHEVRMFCYPYGRYNRSVVRSLRDAGYQGARTTRMLAWALDFKPFEMPTTLQAYPHARAAYLRNLTRAGNWRGTLEYLTRFAQVDGWVELGKRLFDLVLEQGGVWHLYGHSWEIDELGLWQDLARMLDYVCRREGVTYVSNRCLLRLFPPQQDTLTHSKNNEDRLSP